MHHAIRLPRVGFAGLALLALCGLGLLAGCDVPKPPLEQLTPVLGAETPTILPAGAPTYTPVPMTLPPTGRIWFLRGGHVWTSAPDGSGARQMSADASDSAPAPSRDGSHVAFFSGRKLQVIDVATDQVRTVVSATLSTVQRPAWSPDGRLLAYFTDDPATAGDEIAWSVPLAGGPPSRITVLHNEGFPQGPTFEQVICWTDDMRRIAVSGAMGPIYVIPLDVTAGDPLTVNGGEPEWSPDNRNLLYTETMNGAIAIYDVVGDSFAPFRSEKRLDGTRLGDYAQGPWPRFNAATQLILYRAQGDNHVPAVAVRGRDSSEQLFLPGNNPAWAPDGQWIVYETGGLQQTENGLQWQAKGIARIRADGSGQTDIVSDAAWPAWSK